MPAIQVRTIKHDSWHDTQRTWDQEGFLSSGNPAYKTPRARALLDALGAGDDDSSCVLGVSEDGRWALIGVTRYAAEMTDAMAQAFQERVSAKLATLTDAEIERFGDVSGRDLRRSAACDVALLGKVRSWSSANDKERAWALSLGKDGARRTVAEMILDEEELP